MFSQEVQAELLRQGWSPDREVDIHEWRSHLMSHGFSMSPAAEAVLRSFGGLMILPVRTPADKCRAGVIEFDPVTHVLSECSRVAFWQGKLGLDLTPLGVLHSGEMILLLAESGAVFGEWGNMVFQYGGSFEDSLAETLLFAKRRPAAFRVGPDGNLIPCS